MTEASKPIRLGELPAAEARAIFERYVARLAERLGAEPDIDEAVHEDREVILVRSRLSATELEAIVAALWKRREAGSHAETTDSVP